MKNIAHLLDVVDKVRDHVALGLMSDPGLSKTSQVKQWAEKNDRRYCELIISQRMPSEISGMPMPVAKTRTMEIFDFQTLLTLKDGDVLAFDEFTNGNIQTLNACLTLIQERVMLSGKELPSLLIVAMGNPQGKCDLLPQTKQRFWWVDVLWDANTWVDYMTRTWGFRPSPKLVSAINDQYQNGFGNASTYNYYTPRTIENLLRIALQIERTDQFWDACQDLAPSVLSGLYDTITKVDKFYKIQQELMTWVMKTVRDGEAYPWTTYVLSELDKCHTMGELRRFVDVLEREGTAPEFVEYMKSTGDEVE